MVASCGDPSATTSFAYDVPYPGESVPVEAAGPYPGTFTASATVTVGPQTHPPLGITDNSPPFPFNVPGSREQPTGSLISIEAAFEIDSSVGHARGHGKVPTDGHEEVPTPRVTHEPG